MRSRAIALLALVVASMAAGQDAPRPPSGAGGYRLALPGYRFEFPRDHFDHPEFQTEWWYYTGNLRAKDGRRFGFELTFFRQAVDRSPGSSLSPWSLRDAYLAHFALSDLDGGSFWHDERVNRAGPGLAGVDAGTGFVWNGNWRARIEGSGGTQSLEAVALRHSLRLALTSQKPPVVHGTDGISRKGPGRGEASHYVTFTRLRASGRLEFDGRSFEVEGSAWMDHEFFTNQLGRNQRGWDWLSVQLDDGSELMAFRLRRADGTIDPFSAGTFVFPDGRAVHLEASAFSMAAAGQQWKSPKTGASYPIAWRVRVPATRLDVEVRTPLPSQELVAVTGWTPTYWEGAVTVVGTQRGAPVKGVGYLELTGYDKAVVIGR